MFVFPFTYARVVHQLSIAANTDDYNIHTALGSPANPVNVKLTIDAAVIIGSTVAGQAALTTGALAAGSIVEIVNKGSIIGRGGNGGAGGNATYPTCGSGGSGQAGSDALNTAVVLFMDNTDGNIFGGGGGGAGVGARCATTGVDNIAAGGHSGGGGAGTVGGSGGTPGTASGGTSNIPGATGNTGSTTGGAGVTVGINANISGDGGEYGETGGPVTVIGTGNVCQAAHGSGGAPGKAIELNGNSIIWLGGNNPTQVKGAVS